MSRLKNHTVESAPEASQPILENLKKGGKFLNIFRGMANNPGVLKGFLDFKGALGAHGTIGADAHEAVAVLLAQRNSCDYCMSAHAGLAKKMGFSDEQIIAARKGEGAKDDRTGAIVRFAAAVLDADAGNVSDTDLNKAREAGLSDADLTEVVAAIALNYFTNIFNHVNDTEIDIPTVIKAGAL